MAVGFQPGWSKMLDWPPAAATSAGRSTGRRELAALLIGLGLQHRSRPVAWRPYSSRALSRCCRAGRSSSGVAGQPFAGCLSFLLSAATSRICSRCALRSSGFIRPTFTTSLARFALASGRLEVVSVI